jgi:hypothetical protein
MSMSPDQLEAEALELPIWERAALAHRLLEGLAETEHTKPRYTPNTSPDKWVVNGYPLHHETTHLRASFE